MLTWRVDNNAALHAIRNEGSTKSWPLSVLSCSILTRCLERNLVLEPVRVSSEENLVASLFKSVANWSLSDSAATKDVYQVGQTRCRSDGFRQVQESSNILLLDQGRSGDLGHRQPHPGRSLESV